jgi:hypothetical protein
VASGTALAPAVGSLDEWSNRRSTVGSHRRGGAVQHILVLDGGDLSPPAPSPAEAHGPHEMPPESTNDMMNMIPGLI